ncbi:MAG: pyridoxamine 5'-phosphate oxidase family protein [Candidatus Binataceae bacterium]|jgi:hypothetical protein
MPGYAVAAASEGKRLLPWSWARERLEKSKNYWISTTRPDGRPHSVPIWGIWMDQRFVFSSGRESRKARNLAANPRCVITNDNGDEAVIVEGIAFETADLALLRRYKQRYDPKYNWDLDLAMGPFFIVEPEVVFAFIDHPGEFTQTATRWKFAAA